MVRAHPTVPASTPFKSESPPNCRDICAVACRSPVLANPDPFTHNSARLGAGGSNDNFSSGEFWLAAGHCAGGFDFTCRQPGLHPRAGAGLQR